MDTMVTVRDLKQFLDRRKQVEIPPVFLKSANNYKNLQPRVTSKIAKDNARKIHINSRQAFNALSRQWHEETFVLSSTTEICSHPAYLEIINMGDKVIPFILEDLQKSPSHWFSALRYITGSDPVLPEQRGRMKQMAKAWIDWGFENGYLDH